MLASIVSTTLVLFIGYHFARKLTRLINQLTRLMNEYNGNQAIIGYGANGTFKEFHQLRNALRGVAKTQKSALRQSYSREQGLAVTLDSIDNALITTDAEGLVAHMNPVASNSPSGLLSLPSSVVWHYSRRPVIMCSPVSPIRVAAWTGDKYSPLSSPQKAQGSGSLKSMLCKAIIRKCQNAKYDELS